jgi:hypothetical protein
MTTLQETSQFVVKDSIDIEPIDEDMDLEEQQQQTSFDISEVGQTIKVASEGALTGKTVSTYRRYPFLLCPYSLRLTLITNSSLFKAFQRYIVEFESVEVKGAIVHPNNYTPTLIARWIHHKCEKPDPSDPSTHQCERLSFSHTLKMRAAISYHYAQDESRGSEKWHQDRQGGWLGNPALSHTVSRYMISLQRRKVLSPLA